LRSDAGADPCDGISRGVSFYVEESGDIEAVVIGKALSRT